MLRNHLATEKVEVKLYQLQLRDLSFDSQVGSEVISPTAVTILHLATVPFERKQDEIEVLENKSSIITVR